MEGKTVTGRGREFVVRTVALAAALAAVVLAGAAGVRAAEAPAVARAGAQREVVAVFNFAQRDDNPKYAWLSKGLADLLINQLSDLPQITIVSRDRMQMLVSEYESLLHKSLQENRPELRMAGETLSAKRVVFGTYGVAGDEVTLTLQVSGVADEAVLFQTQVKGRYAEALNLERELARRLRAYFLGQGTEKVPLADVPQWTSQVGSAEHLYAGVNLFDQGDYAEAWLRFRQAAKADPQYADAVYWQGRMFYYLTLYDNARPLLDDFFTRWPHHPRAGDAAIELLDTWRQTMDDPAALGQAYLALRERVDPRAIVYNKALPGEESRSLLRSYIGGFAVQALRQQGEYEAAAKLASEVMWEARSARPGNISDTSYAREWGNYEKLANISGAEAYLLTDVLPIGDGCLGHVKIFQMKHERPWYFVWDDNDPKHFGQPEFIRRGDKYVMRWGEAWEHIIVAPEGYQFSSLRASITLHHEPKSQPFDVCCTFAFAGTYFAGCGWSTEGAIEPRIIPVPHRCRYLLIQGYADTPDGSGTQVVPAMSQDYVGRYRFDVEFEPVPPDDCQIRLNLGNQTDVKVTIDGQPTIREEGLIRGVTPGKHLISVTPVRGTARGPSAILMPVEQEITVADKGVTECTIVPPFSDAARPAGWRNTVTLARDYPLAKVPPAMWLTETSPPSLLRVQRGSRRGQLVAVWSFRENLWLSYSQDDGAHWTPTERLPIPVDTAHNQLAPQLIQDEQGRFCLAFISDRGIERAHYPYVCWSDDLRCWSAPVRVAPVVVDKLHFLQDRSGRYLLLLPPLWRPEDLGWQRRQNGANVASYERVNLTKAMQQKYGRRKAVLLSSADLRHWTELEHNLGTPQLRDVDLVQTADGLFHAVFTQQSAQQPDGMTPWAIDHQTSPDAAHWGSFAAVADEQPWEISNPRIATDGRQILGSYCADGDHVQIFKVGSGRSTSGWWGLPSERNALYFDPPGFGCQLHWLWLKADRLNDNLTEGELYYTSTDEAGSPTWFDRLPRKSQGGSKEPHDDQPSNK